MAKTQTLKNQLLETQKLVNLYIKLKYALVTDNGLLAKCFCCGRMWLLDSTKAKKEYHASHFFREDLYASVRFHHDNLRPSDSHCNRKLHGNLSLYAEKLVDEIGVHRFTELSFLKNKTKKWTPLELDEIKKEHKQLINLMSEKLKLLNQE